MSTDTLDGTFNFRDTGGMPRKTAGATRAGVLYRSDALSTLTPEGLEQLAASDIGVVVDFRTPMERQMAPDRLPVTRPFQVVELSILEGAVTGAAQQAMQVAAQQGDPDAAASAVSAALAHLPTLGELYIGMLEHGAAAFAEVARLVAASADHQQTAVLIHCTAGKDRTGVAAALILDAVGVDRDAVVADYAASEANLAGTWADGMYAMIERMGVPLTRELKDLVVATPPVAIAQALAEVDSAHGGSAAYLASGGLTDDELAALRRRLAG